MMTTGTETRLYHCQDNDNLLRLVYEDGELDEIQVSDELAREWTIISWRDLKKAINHPLNRPDSDDDGEPD